MAGESGAGDGAREGDERGDTEDEEGSEKEGRGRGTGARVTDGLVITGACMHAYASSAPGLFESRIVRIARRQKAAIRAE